MTQPLPIGNFKNKKSVTLEILNDAVKNYNLNDKVGQMFVVDIEFCEYEDPRIRFPLAIEVFITKCFKTNLDGTIKGLAEDEYDLNNIWNKLKDPEDRQEKVEEPKPRMEAKVVINNDVYKDIEGIVNKDKVQEDCVRRREAIKALFSKLRGNIPQIQIKMKKQINQMTGGGIISRVGIRIHTILK